MLMDKQRSKLSYCCQLNVSHKYLWFCERNELWNIFKIFLIFREMAPSLQSRLFKKRYTCKRQIREWIQVFLESPLLKVPIDFQYLPLTRYPGYEEVDEHRADDARVLRAPEYGGGGEVESRPQQDLAQVVGVAGQRPQP